MKLKVLLLIFMVAFRQHTHAQKSMQRLSLDTYLDKVEAVWMAQMIAVIAGWQFEHRQASVEWIDKYQPDKLKLLSSNGGAPLDDDWYYEIAALRGFERYGIDMTLEQLGQQWVDNRVGTWGSSEMARLNLERGVPATKSGHPRYNRLWFTMGNQCRGELFGLLAPGMPDVAATLSGKLGHINSYAEGADGGILVSTMVSLAFLESDPKKIIRLALDVLHQDTPHHRCISQVIAHAEAGMSFQQVCSAVEDDWHIVYPATNNAVSNLGLAIAAIWFGEGDFLKTINLAFSAADFTDADCNAAIAGSVVAAIAGSKCLPIQFVEPLKNRVIGTNVGPLAIKPPVNMSITELAQRTVAIGKRIVANEGGTIDGASIAVPEGMIRTRPAELFSPNDFTSFWNPDWKLERAGHGAPGGGHRGIRGGTFLDGMVLSTFPRDEVRGVVLRRAYKVNNNDSLKVEVAADPGRVWKLDVMINNDKVFSELVDGGPAIHWYGTKDDYFPPPTEEYIKSSQLRRFRNVAIDLTPYSGKEIVIRLYQHSLVRNRFPGNAYWRNLRIE
jgi:hypothetical protein